MNINFDQIWDKVIIPLKGKTIYTLDEQKANFIVDVNNNFLERDSENESPSQKITKEVFAVVYNHIMQNGEITRTYINEKIPRRYSSIICAVLAKAPNIGYDIKPVRLYKNCNL
jgi:hypothetical protein